MLHRERASEGRPDGARAAHGAALAAVGAALAAVGAERRRALARGSSPDRAAAEGSRPTQQAPLRPSTSLHSLHSAEGQAELTRARAMQGIRREDAARTVQRRWRGLHARLVLGCGMGGSRARLASASGSGPGRRRALGGSLAEVHTQGEAHELPGELPRGWCRWHEACAASERWRCAGRELRERSERHARDRFLARASAVLLAPAGSKEARTARLWASVGFASFDPTARALGYAWKRELICAWVRWQQWTDGIRVDRVARPGAVRAPAGQVAGRDGRSARRERRALRRWVSPAPEIL